VYYNAWNTFACHCAPLLSIVFYGLRNAHTLSKHSVSYAPSGS